MSRYLRSGGSTTAQALDRSKRYKYNSTGSLVEYSGTPAPEDIVFSGSKSALRRIEDIERNVSILAAKALTSDGNDSSEGSYWGSSTNYSSQQNFSGGIQMRSSISAYSNNSYNIGSSSNRFANVYATTFTGDLSGTASAVNATANNSASETVYLTFVDGTTGSQGIETDTGLTYNPSSNTLSTSVFSGTATNAQYADLAENYVADKKYEPGTVVEFGGAEEVTIAASGSPRIAGVVSTAPGFLMNTGLTGANVVAVAFTGRVPCKVSGPVRKGDIMVAGPNGHAMRAPSEPKAGMVIGKALANFDGQSGIIEVAVGR